jgi:hypothetical protein
MMFVDTDDKKTDPDYLVSLYRSRWLMAHNRLHAVVHDGSTSAAEQWDRYLEDLEKADEVAKQPA